MTDFEIRTTGIGWAMQPGGIVRTAGIGMIDLDELATQLEPELVDPASMFVETTATRPDVAAPTCEPHRYTIHVPTPDHATLSIGMASSDQPWHIQDTGITGRTDSHIHWHTAVGDDTQSILLLGNATNERKDVPGGHKGVASANTGFAVITEGASHVDARLQQFVVSREEDVIVRAPTTGKVVTLQADDGIVEAVAGQSATVGARAKVLLAADEGLTFTDPGYKEARQKAESTYLFSKFSKGAQVWMDVLVSGETLIKTFLNQSQSPEKESSGWKTGSNVNKVKFAIDAAKLVSTAAREVDSYTKFTGMASAGVYSSGGASMVGDVAASIFGNLSASVTSVVSASVLGMTSSVKGFLYTSLWAGRELSVKSRKDLKLEGENGSASLKSKEGMTVASTTAAVTVQGEKDVRLNSVAGKAFVHGTTEAVFASGPGGGFGVAANEGELHVGMLTGVNEFKAAGKDASQALVIKKNTSAELGFKDGSVFVQEGLIKIESPEVKILAKSGGDVKVNGAKILLG